MLRNHDVLVSTAGMYGEETCVISIQFTDGRDLEKYVLDRTWGIGSSSELGGCSLGLVDFTPWIFWLRFPIMLASVEGKYLVALEIVSPGHDE